MTGGVAEVNTLSAAIPSYSALDRDAAFFEKELPCAQSLIGDGEGQMQLSLTIVRRDPTARRVQPRDGGAAPEEEQDGRLPRVERYQALSSIEYAKAEDISIKIDNCVEIVHVESG